MSKLYFVLLLIASLVAMAGLGVLILVSITEMEQLIAPTNNPYGMEPLNCSRFFAGVLRGKFAKCERSCGAE